MKDIFFLIICILPLFVETYRLPIIKGDSIEDPLYLNKLFDRFKSFFNLNYLSEDTNISGKGIFDREVSSPVFKVWKLLLFFFFLDL